MFPPTQRVLPPRVHLMHSGEFGQGPVVYWMSREQRLADNWALVHAEDVARSRNAAVVIFFGLAPSFPGATLRAYDAMLRGLRELERGARPLNLGFALRIGDPAKACVRLVRELGAAALVVDFDPLRVKQDWRRRVAEAVRIPVVEVDAHNLVPARIVSDKREYAARTIRPKIHRRLEDFLDPFPAPAVHPVPPPELPPTDWDAAFAALDVDRSVGPVPGFVPGEAAGRKLLADFLKHRLTGYATRRNDPSLKGLSGLSPYLHFGQLSPQRAVLDVLASQVPAEDRDAFVEEAVVRRELSDNFVLHAPDYDSLDAGPAWALASLDKHRRDPRSFLYTHDEFEQALTHDPAWNAAQREMVRTGKMHGYMRMYWAKKILEWSASPEEAYTTAITLNDRYELDGRDPNGFVGVLWSIAGLHDRPWGERPIYGVVRTMTLGGLSRKFDLAAYIDRIERLGRPAPDAAPKPSIRRTKPGRPR